MTQTRIFASVWDAIDDSSEDAATMTMRSNVMIAIKDQVRKGSTTQAQAARRLGVPWPRLSDLLMARSQVFPRYLMTLATRAGLKVKIAVRSTA